MATVLVSVALVAASIWIAIRMESGLDSPAARALPADTGPVRPARCRFRHPGTRPAAEGPVGSGLVAMKREPPWMRRIARVMRSKL